MKNIVYVILALSLPVWAESPHCTSESVGGNIATQCGDGAVTIVKGTGVIMVCKTDISDVTCKSF